MNTQVSERVHDGAKALLSEWKQAVIEFYTMLLRWYAKQSLHMPDLSLPSYWLPRALSRLELKVSSVLDQVADAKRILAYRSLAPSQLLQVFRWCEYLTVEQVDLYVEAIRELPPLVKEAAMRLSPPDHYNVTEMEAWHLVMAKLLQKELTYTLLESVSKKVEDEADAVRMLRWFLQFGMADNSRLTTVRDALIGRLTEGEWKKLAVEKYWWSLNSFISRSWVVLALKDQLAVFADVGEKRSAIGAQMYLDRAKECLGPVERCELFRLLGGAKGVQQSIKHAAAQALLKDAQDFVLAVPAV